MVSMIVVAQFQASMVCISLWFWRAWERGYAVAVAQIQALNGLPSSLHMYFTSTCISLSCYNYNNYYSDCMYFLHCTYMTLYLYVLLHVNVLAFTYTCNLLS